MKNKLIWYPFAQGDYSLQTTNINKNYMIFYDVVKILDEFTVKYTVSGELFFSVKEKHDTLNLFIDEFELDILNS